MPTILITGCSSGFGLATARLFAGRDWDVVATVRTAEEAGPLRSDRIRVVPLEITDGRSIAAAVEAAGPIHALVNNAGIGFLNALEGTPMETARLLFEVNTLGPIAMMQAVLPGMRARGAGVIVNIGSSATWQADPLLSVYTASKSAVNGVSESLALEIAPFGIHVRVVIPGRAPTTGFNDNARQLMKSGFPAAYEELVQQVFAGWQADTGPTTMPDEVAEAVWQAVTLDGPFRYIPAGPGVAPTLPQLRAA